MVLCTACDPFKDRGCNFSFLKTPECIINLPITIYALLSNFWISGFTRFFAPPRPGPPRGFSLSPRPTPPRPADFYPCPAPPRRKMLRPAHPWLAALLEIRANPASHQAQSHSTGKSMIEFDIPLMHCRLARRPRPHYTLVGGPSSCYQAREIAKPRQLL